MRTRSAPTHQSETPPASRPGARLPYDRHVNQTQQPAGWLIRVESQPGFTDSPAVLIAFSKALTADETLHSAAPTLDPSTGTLRADITIEEPRQGRAEELTIAAFYRALQAAGFNTEQPGWQLIVQVLAPLPAADE